MPDEQDTPTPEPTPEDSTPEQEPQGEQSQEVASGGAERSEEQASDSAPEPTDEQAAALAAAMSAINQVQGVADSAAPPVDASAQPKPGAGMDNDAKPFMAPEFADSLDEATKNAIGLLSDVHMDVRIELGRTRMFVEDVLKLSDGAVVELDKLAGDPVDVFVNDRCVAKGEVLVLNDLFCVRINEVVDITQSEED
jgi:flagellar motor switch protein FliN/FliY